MYRHIPYSDAVVYLYVVAGEYMYSNERLSKRWLDNIERWLGPTTTRWVELSMSKPTNQYTVKNGLLQ